MKKRRNMQIPRKPDRWFDGRIRAWTGLAPLDQRHVNLAIDALRAAARPSVIFWGADIQTRFEMMLFQTELYDRHLSTGAYEMAWLALRRAQSAEFEPGCDKRSALLERAASNLEARI